MRKGLGEVWDGWGMEKGGEIEGGLGLAGAREGHDVVGGGVAVLGRAAWERGHAARDLEVLRWVARFRFVTGRAVAERFGVSLQRSNARLRRLEPLGWSRP